MAQDINRRSFLDWAVFALGAVFSAVIGIPLVAYTLDPRHRKGGAGNLKPVDGIRLNELELNTPKQGVIRDTRRDGWTLYPNDVIGRVWVVKTGPAAADLIVFTTICPHLGCSVNINAAGNGFACPCHAAAFTTDGTRTGANPAARGMDTLTWEVDPHDPHRLLVQYQKFATSIAEKQLV